MSGYEQFQDYKNFQCMTYEGLKLAVNYICMNLNCHGSDYPYWYDMYCYTSKSFIVLQWRRDNNKLPTAKLGESICNDKIINFVRDKHKCSCSSVYFNAVKF